MTDSRVLDDKEVLIAANQILQQYTGDVLDAKLHAARLSDQFLEEGAIDGHLTWLKILRAILDMTDGEREDGEMLH